MKEYMIVINRVEYLASAYSARKALDGVLRSIIGTRTAEKMLPLNICVTRKHNRQTNKPNEPSGSATR